MTAGVVGINAGSPLAVEENGVSGSFRPVLSVRFFPIPFFRIRFFPVLSPLAVEENWVSGSVASGSVAVLSRRAPMADSLFGRRAWIRKEVFERWYIVQRYKTAYADRLPS